MGAPREAATMLPVRVARGGWRKLVHPTVVELEEAVSRAIGDMRTEAGHLRFRTLEKVQDFVCSRVRAELQVAIGAEFDADEVDADEVETGGVLLKVFTDRVGPVYVVMAPAPVKPMPPVGRVGLKVTGKMPGGL